jgi:serine/threonine protein kinase
MINKKYNLISKIGEGSFGSIYKAENIRTSEYVAIKVEPIDSGLNSIKSESKKYQYILQYDVDKNFVNKYLSVKDIIIKNPTFNLKSIYNVLKNKQKTANSYIWKFE